MKIAVTGYEGYVGSYLVKEFGYEPVYGDVTVEDSMVSEYARIKPDILIHCASLTNVDLCEKNISDAFNINVLGTMRVVNAFRCPIVYLSTDHVFNGKPRLWLPTESTKPDPLNVYGMTKYAGEVMALTSTYPVLIVRSSKLFSYHMLKKDIVDLQSGLRKEYTGLIKRNFTHRNHFCTWLSKLITRDWEQPGGNIVHVASSVSRSYYEFWTMLASELGIDASLVSERRYPLDNATSRPFHGGLSVKKFGRMRLSSFSMQDGFGLVKEEMKNDV